MWSNDTWDGMSMVVNFTASPIKTMRLRKLKRFEVMEIRGVKVFAHWSVLSEQ
jgi:hypothetical protein